MRRPPQSAVTCHAAVAAHRQGSQTVQGPIGTSRNPNAQRQQRGRKDQRQHRGNAKTKDHGRGQLLPPQRRRAVDRVTTANEVKRQAEHHRRQTCHRGDRGQQHRPDTGLCGAHNRLKTRHIARIFLIGIDKNNVVVHHNPRQSHDARAGHDDREGLIHHQHPDQNPRGRQNHRQEHQHRVVKAVELSEQDHEHQPQSAGKSLHQERAALLLVLLITGPFKADAIGKWLFCFNPLGQRRNPLIRIDRRRGQSGPVIDLCLSRCHGNRIGRHDHLIARGRRRGAKQHRNRRRDRFLLQHGRTRCSFLTIFQNAAQPQFDHLSRIIAQCGQGQRDIA